ncbi:MAG: TrmH family RNA methyltransferase [Arenimonas sp.]|jgi:TrmH RNA methyltransferase
MPERKPPGGESLYRGPARAPRDKRERERDRERSGQPARSRDTEQPSAERQPAARPPLRERIGVRPPTRDPAARDAATPRPVPEQRVYGLNACLALFAKRPQALRKVWLLESRIPALKAVLAYCAQHRLGYTLVEASDLEKLSGSAHHEGVVFGAMPAEEVSLSAWLSELAPGPQLAIWLDGVGNPHNFGAILRSAAHFGVAGVLLSRESTLTLSGAAARVAEGGAEALPMVRLGGASDNAMAQLQAAGFTVAATMVRGGQSLYATQLPDRLVLLMGAEQTGVDAQLARASALKLLIPGSGAVESLNVASATSVLLSEWARQQQRK